MYGRPALFVLGSTLALACSGSSPAEPAPAPAKADATKAVAKAEPSRDAKAVDAKIVDTKAVDTKAVDAKAVDAKAPEPIAPPTPGAAAPLRAVALHDHSIDLAVDRDAIYVLLDGEPVPFVDGAFVRKPELGAGLAPCVAFDAAECQVFAFTGDVNGPLGAWVTVAQEDERAGSRYAVYRYQGDRWQGVDLGKGVLVGYYAHLVEREGALVGFLRWAADPDQDLLRGKEESDEASAFDKKVAKAMRRAKSGWVHVAGPERALPELPKGLEVRAVATAGDGTLHALADVPDEYGMEGAPRLLAWRPGSSKAETVAVPELERAQQLGLWASAGGLAIGGRIPAGEEAYESYLAVSQGDAWQRVPTSLPDRREDAVTVLGAARTPEGALWVAVGDRWNTAAEPKPVWHQPAGGEWQPVPLPVVDASMVRRGNDGAGKGETGTTVVPAPAMPKAWVTELVWAGGAIWAVLHYGEDLVAVVTTHAGTGPVTVLPTVDEVLRERGWAPEQGS